MKKAIVTGANGFVGYWLLRELQNNGVHVTAVIKDEKEDISLLSEFNDIDIIYCDICQLNTLCEKVCDRDYDVMYHLAWVAAGGMGRADYSIQLNNVKYACDAVNVAKNLGCNKILFAGTITEKNAENILSLSGKAVNNIYGICKHFTHCLIDVECQKIGIDYVWMQFSNLFGPYSINGNIIGYTIKNLLQGKDACFGPAQQPYDFLYIEDLVYAAYLLGEKKTTKRCYYLGSGNVMLLSDYLHEVGDVLGFENNIKIGVLPDDGTRYYSEWFDITSLKLDTSYEPRVPFRDGLIKTINWLKTIL